MENLKRAQEIWEKSTEIFDKIDEKNKREWFNNLIDELEECSAITRLQEKRNSMTEEQKNKLYKNSAITISWMLVRSTGIYPLYKSLKGTINRTKHTIKHWFKNALKYDFFEQIPCRFLVQLGILQQPEGITKNKLMEDIKKDAKNFHTCLWICEGICTCIPEAEPAIPYIKIAKTYTKWYKDHWTEIITDRLNKHKKIKIQTQTNKELSDTFTSEKKQKKAA